jgi:hypothetical protein
MITRRNRVFARLCGVGVCAISLGVAQLSWSMGTPPFDEDVRSGLGESTTQAIAAKGCLSVDETIEATSQYRNLKTRQPIGDKKITATVAFPGRDSKGSRIITVSYTSTTDQNGVAQFAIPLGGALADAEAALRRDKFYKDVKRVRGRINLSFSSEDTLKRSIRYVPSRGLFFKMCRVV